MTQVIGLGAGGHAKVVIEILRLIEQYQIVGLLDRKPENWGREVLGVPILGGDELLKEIYTKGVRCAFIGLGTTGNTTPRTELYARARNHGFELAPAVHPQAIISESAMIGCGPTIMASAVINAGARLGDNVVVNTGAIVEHDCILSSHVHVATGARLAGGVQVGEGAHIGIGATIKQLVRIGDNAVIGAGAVVINDVPNDVVVVGVPARAKS